MTDIKLQVENVNGVIILTAQCDDWRIVVAGNDVWPRLGLRIQQRLREEKGKSQ